jgi:ABC-type sugar transport system ATPase subunit
VFRLCDRITVLRDGHYVGTFERDRVTSDDIVQAMVGRRIPVRTGSSGRDAPDQATPPVDRRPLLRLDALTRRPWFEDVSLSIARGEIVGVFGLVGSGRTELLETVVGLHHADRGTLTLENAARRFTSPRAAARAGVVLVPEDRQRSGLFFNLNVRHNLLLPTAVARRARIVRETERASSEALLRQWRIVASSIDATPDMLSGGNQQKVVVAKWLALQPRVLLLDEPTKGVDVGAKFEIHGIVRDMAAKGAACLMVSSDLPEVLALADRVIVMREGRLRGELAAPEADEEGVMRLATTSPGAAA